uniref:Uncharacterized protein n=1 Tax=Arundo donax TaxID=35708 RepID=A0A0A9AVA4_ARUDO
MPMFQSTLDIPLTNAACKSSHPTVKKNKCYFTAA